MAEMGMKGLGGGLRPKMGGGGGAEKKAAPKMGEESKPEGEGGGAIELHDHGDGTAHTVIGGKQEEHPDMHHALAHIAHKAMNGGPHFHAHHDGMSLHSHGIHDSGEHTETREHDSPEDMHSAMDEVMGGGEGGGGHEAAASEEPSLGGFRG